MGTSKTSTAKDNESPATDDRRIAAYEKQFLALEGKVYKLEAENARLRARIKVLEEAKPGAVMQAMTDAELEARLEPMLQELGYVKKNP